MKTKNNCATAPDRTAEALATLEAGIVALVESGDWQRYLTMQACFHSYSFSNLLLIQAQRPDATRVAGFQAWKKVGRSVMKGERAIYVLAPRFCKALPEVEPDAEDDGGKDEPEGRRVAYFRPVAVFDVSQTEGDPLPEPVQKLTGEDDGGLFERLRAFSEARGCPVSVEDFPGQANGFYDPERHAITVRSGLSPAQQAKTLCHEIGHAMLHRDLAEYRAHRADHELEAESVAFLVLLHFGIDAGAYSFGYTATWQGGGPEAIKALKTCATRIQGAAKAVIDGIRGDGSNVSADDETIE